MKITPIIFFLFLSHCVFAQVSFPLLGNGNWYKVASIGGQHGYIDYIYWHATPHNPSIAKGEIQFINSMNFTVQNHQTMGYAGWNQPQFALLNFGGTSELWVKATNGVATGTFKVINSINATVSDGTVSDSNLSDNGGNLTIYDKLQDQSNTFIGDIRSSGKLFQGGYSYGGGNINTNSIEIGGSNPVNNSGQATIFLNHHNVMSHQLRYSNGGLFLEAAGNGYSTTSTPNLYVGGNVGIGTINPQQKLHVNGTVYSTEVKVDVNAGTGPDYVFEPTYQLPSLTEIESYIKANKHLPEVPSAKEMETNGINLSEMNMLLLKKVEELTLHLIEMNNRVRDLEAENKKLRRKR